MSFDRLFAEVLAFDPALATPGGFSFPDCYKANEEDPLRRGGRFVHATDA